MTRVGHCTPQRYHSCSALSQACGDEGLAASIMVQSWPACNHHMLMFFQMAWQVTPGLNHVHFRSIGAAPNAQRSNALCCFKVKGTLHCFKQVFGNVPEHMRQGKETRCAERCWLACW